MKEVMILTGAGQIGMAIARRTGYGMKVIVGDKYMEKAISTADTMRNAGFDTLPVEMACRLARQFSTLYTRHNNMEKSAS